MTVIENTPGGIQDFNNHVKLMATKLFRKRTLLLPSRSSLSVDHVVFSAPLGELPRRPSSSTMPLVVGNSALAPSENVEVSLCPPLGSASAEKVEEESCNTFKGRAA